MVSNQSDLFLREHAFVHSEVVAKAETFNIDYLLKEMTELQLRTCPQGLNSLSWLFWHLARVEDGCVSCIVMGRPQLFDEEDWGAKMGVSRRDAGTGMSKDDVAEFSKKVDLATLWAYRNAVGRRTRAMVGELWPDLWTAPIEAANVRQAAAVGVISADAAVEMEDFLTSRSRESGLFWWGLNHTLMHLGQVTMVQSIVKQRIKPNAS